MSIEHDTQIIEDGLDDLLEQYRGKPRFEAQLAALLRPIQQLEDDIWAVIWGRVIDNAIGVQLDHIGKLVGQPREGREDDVYRVFIKARILINRTHGRPNDVIRVLRAVETTRFQYSELYPATILLSYLGVPTVPPAVLIELGRAARSGGVRLMLTYGAEEFFSCCAGTANVEDAVRGAAPEDLSTGGYMSASQLTA